MADIAQRTVRAEPPRRPERVIELDAIGAVGDAARPLSVAERLLQITAVRPAASGRFEVVGGPIFLASEAG